MNLTPEQLKGKIRSFANKNNVRAQEVLQMIMFEKLLSRLAVSDYCDNFIIKGGVLIASLIGVASRTTMDLDATIRGLKMERQEIEDVINDVLNIDLEDGVTFRFEHLSMIRKQDQYNNFRVHLSALFRKMIITLKIDITTGDIIIPAAIKYSYTKIFDGNPISILAYPVETVLAEKYETIISRNIAMTRARDYYDFFKLIKTQRENVDCELLKEAILRISEQRNSLDIIHDWESVLVDIKEASNLRDLWNNYKRNNQYISDIQFDEIIEVIHEVSKQLGI